MDLETDTALVINSYKELLQHQNDQMIEKDGFSFNNYLETCKLPSSQYSNQETESVTQNPIFIKRDKTPKFDFDDEMKGLIKSDLKENLKLANEAQNMVIK